MPEADEKLVELDQEDAVEVSLEQESPAEEYSATESTTQPEAETEYAMVMKSAITEYKVCGC